MKVRGGRRRSYTRQLARMNRALKSLSRAFSRATRTVQHSTSALNAFAAAASRSNPTASTGS